MAEHSSTPSPSSAVTPPALALQHIAKRFVQGGQVVHVLEDACLTIAPGQCVALVGESGCGKSTLLHIAGLLAPADSGHIHIRGQDATGGKEALRTALRRHHIGFVYQYHYLLAGFSAEENVAMPLRLQGKSAAKATQDARAILAEMGLEDRMQHRPGALSGGQQQRVAIARAMVTRPAVLLADEPTGNLDPKTAETVAHLLFETAKRHQQAILIATHSKELAARADRILTLEQGRVVEVA